MSPKITFWRIFPKLVSLLIISFFLSGCANAGSWGAKPKNPMLGAGLQGYNHTQFEISGFSINEGYGSIGGTVCCVMLAAIIGFDLTKFRCWWKFCGIDLFPLNMHD
ncbi:hypothetical protein ABN117_19485 [Providencia manganoxydans]